MILLKVRFGPITLIEPGYRYNEFQLPGIPEVSWSSNTEAGKLYTLYVMGKIGNFPIVF